MPAVRRTGLRAAAREEQARERQRVTVENPLRGRDATTEVADDVRERDGGDAGVEVDDERHRADTDEEKGPAHAGVWMRSHEVNVGSLTEIDYSATIFTVLDRI
ncbi:hypothetical protein [Rhodococcus opacus]|uniref:hypothetical protein n=1 Tax=Rhodococcus opacus TaxID=37919 RepID=UPI002955C305|nr:hypothetical protein [Rhodococcus opacus]MDV7088269.1 hypothetical protein [Rhodococcus opacus]